MKLRSRTETTIRYVTQAFFLILMTYLAYMHAHKGLAGGFASIDTLCPFGGVETVYKTISDGGFLQRVGMPAIILMIGTIVMTLVVGRAFCGSICPLGTMQEWLYNIFGKIIPSSIRKKLQIPSVADNVLRWLKYILLFVIVFYTWMYHDLVFRPYDPWVAYAHMWGGDWEELFGEFQWAFIVLIASLLLTIILSRPFCKYLCPFGAFLGIFSKISWIKINRNNPTCTHCKACNRSCPMDINIEGKSRVTSAECIECGLCEAVCPVPSTLERKSKVPVIKVAATLIPIVTVVLFLATYGTGKLTGTWKTKATIKTAADIKGSHSLGQIAEAAGVSVKEILIAANLPASMSSESGAMLKTFRMPEGLKKYGLDHFEVDEIRFAFAKIRGEAFVSTEKPKESSREPATSEVQKSIESSSKDSAAQISPDVRKETHSVTTNKETSVKPVVKTAAEKSDKKAESVKSAEHVKNEPVHAPTETVAPSGTKLVWGTDVKGSTALKEILSRTGKTKADFIAKFSLPADLDENLALKDIRDQQGKDMEEMKAFFGF